MRARQMAGSVLFVNVVRVHANGCEHWGYGEAGKRVIVRRGGVDFVRWKGKLHPVIRREQYGDNIIELPCRCGWGEGQKQ